MKLTGLLIVLLAISLMIAGCGIFGPEEEPCKDVCDGDVNFSPDYIGYSSFWYDQGDRHSLVGHCGFDYIGGRTGGYGNTLEIRSEECGVHLGWAYYRLLEFKFSGNWTGKVRQSGLRLGDPIVNFKTAYPDWAANSDSTVYWKMITHPTYHSIFDDVYIVAFVDSLNTHGTIDSLWITGRGFPRG